MSDTQRPEDSSAFNSDNLQFNSILSSSSSSLDNSDHNNATQMSSAAALVSNPESNDVVPDIPKHEETTRSSFDLTTPAKKGHLRSLSIPRNSPTHTSVTSPVAPSSGDSVSISTPSSQPSKKGINLGINIFGNPVGRPRAISRRLLSAELGDMSPSSNSSHSQSPTKDDYDTSTASETFKQDSFSHDTDINDQSLLKTPEKLQSFQFEDETTPTNTSRNTTIEEEDTSNDLSEQLRLLASKEMEILEVKEHIKTLEKRKDELEVDLHTLKSNIQRSLMIQVSDPPHRHTVRSPISVAKKNLNKISIGTAVPDPLLDYGYTTSSETTSPEQPRVDSSSSNNTQEKSSWGNTFFSKPLNFIQQMDTMIQQEFEKLHIPVLNDGEMQAAHSDIKRNDSNESFDNIDAREINDPIKSMANDNTSHDVIDTVSNHLWAFVKEVRSNMKNSEQQQQQQQQQQSQLNLSPKKSPARQRIPSFSGRQHYGHYSAKSKRKSEILEPSDESYANVDTAGEEVSSVILDSPGEASDGIVKTVEMKNLGKPSHGDSNDGNQFAGSADMV